MLCHRCLANHYCIYTYTKLKYRVFWKDKIDIYQTGENIYIYSGKLKNHPMLNLQSRHKSTAFCSINWRVYCNKYTVSIALWPRHYNEAIFIHENQTLKMILTRSNDLKSRANIAESSRRKIEKQKSMEGIKSSTPKLVPEPRLNIAILLVKR